MPSRNWRDGRNGNFNIVFLDVNMPDGGALEQLSQIMASPSRPEVITFTGMGNPAGAEIAIKNGAWDYSHCRLKKSSCGFCRKSV
jgi:DNA-binding NtrC family response regulator